MTWSRVSLASGAERTSCSPTPVPSLIACRGLDAHVVYGPVDPDPPAAPAPWPTGNRPVIGFVGRIEPRKGPLDLVRATPAIRRQLPGARVVLVGDDPFGADPAYTAAVVSSGEVEHHSWSASAPGLMRHLDVLVLPSYEEPFGTVLAEAMAVGTPVVATRSGGLPEVVADGVTGRLVSAGDPGGIAAAVLEVFARREEMGAAAREHAKRFAAEDYVERVERPDLAMKIAFDSRPVKDSRGIGRYARCLLEALREADRGEIVESHAPKRCDVFHSPWIDGALLRSPIPMVVTLARPDPAQAAKRVPALGHALQTALPGGAAGRPRDRAHQRRRRRRDQRARDPA